MPFLPYIPFPDCIDVVLKFTQQSIPWFVTMGFKSAVPVNSTILANLYAALDGWMTSDGAALVSSNCSIDGVKLTDLTTVSGVVYNNVFTAGAGTRAGNVLPAQASMCVSLATNLRGRSYRGRNYWSGRVFGDQQTVTTWTSAAVTAFHTAYINLAAQTAAVGFTLSVLSRQNGGVRRTVGVDTAVTNISAKTQMATQRKRLF